MRHRLHLPQDHRLLLMATLGTPDFLGLAIPLALLLGFAQTSSG